MDRVFPLARSNVETLGPFGVLLLVHFVVTKAYREETQRRPTEQGILILGCPLDQRGPAPEIAHYPIRRVFPCADAHYPANRVSLFPSRRHLERKVYPAVLAWTIVDELLVINHPVDQLA